MAIVEIKKRDGSVLHSIAVPSDPAPPAQRLRTAVIAARDAGLCLAGADLSGGDFHNVNLSGLELCGCDLAYARFDGADLSHADLGHASVWHTSFADANMRGANLGSMAGNLASFKGAFLDRANLTSLVIAGCADLIQGPRRDDGYQFFGWVRYPPRGVLKPTLMVSAGCRCFTINEARLHWSRRRWFGRVDNDARRAETMAILDYIEITARARGFLEMPLDPVLASGPLL